jgi:hypothetical protein
MVLEHDTTLCGSTLAGYSGPRLSPFASGRSRRSVRRAGGAWPVLRSAKPSAAGGAEGDRNGGRYGDQDNEQRGDDGHRQAEALRHELRPDEDQDHRQAVVQVDEAVHQPLQREVEGPQAQDGEDDRGVGHGILGDVDPSGQGRNRRNLVRQRKPGGLYL